MMPPRLLTRTRPLTRTGTVRRVAGRGEVVFADERCADCDGRCGVRLRTARRRGPEVDLPVGTTVRVTTPAHSLAWLAGAVFGPPLVAAGAAIAYVAHADASEWIVAAALLGGAAAAVCARRLLAGFAAAFEPRVAVVRAPGE